MPLQCTTYLNAVLQPIINGKTGIFVNGELIKSSLLKRNNLAINAFYEPNCVAIATTCIQGTAVYGGILFNHFGHFLLESLSRLWFFKQNPTTPIIWVKSEDFSEFESFHLDLFAILNITNPFIIVTEPVQVHTLLLPDEAVILPDMIHSEFYKTMGVIKSPLKQKNNLFTHLIKYKKPKSQHIHQTNVWLSRSKFHSGLILNEHLLENILKEYGWIILHPEIESVQKTLDTLVNADRIAGISGSAFHSFLLLESINAQVDIFDRNVINPILILIAEDKKINQTCHAVPLQYAMRTGSPSCWIWKNLDPILKKLNIPITKPSMQPIANTTSDVINVFAREFKCKDYLEIGVAEGSTFLSVDASHKVAVDPVFTADYSKVQSKTCNFYEMFSDHFFEYFSENMLFDLIFLDGLHTFEQTFRDFTNSIRLSHAKTIWIIDDTIPCDKYSIITNQQDAYTERLRETGKNDGSWHGDVFKVPFMIHDYFHEFNLCTVTGHFNPKTIIWRKRLKDFGIHGSHIEHPRTERKQLWGSIAEIAHMNFDYYTQMQHHLRLVTTKDAINLIQADFS